MQITNKLSSDICDLLTLLSPHSNVFKPKFAHVCWVVNVSQIDNLRGLHQIANTGHIQRSKLIPFCHENQCVSVFDCRILIFRIVDVRQLLAGLSHCDWIIGSHIRAACNEAANDFYRWSFPHVICFWLESKAQYSHCCIFKCSDQFFDFGHHRPSLPAVDLNYRVNQQRVAVKLTSNRCERLRVLRKTRSTKPGTRMQELAPNAFVHSDSPCDVMNVAADAFTECSYLINERYL